MSTTAPRHGGPVREGGLLLGTVAGVPVVLSPSWWLGAVLIVVFYAPLVARILPGVGMATSALIAALFTVLLAASVLLHELGHCVVALRFGLPVRRVRLFLLGGLTDIPRSPQAPRQEGVIAAAGPVVSLVLAGLLGLGSIVLEPGGVIWLLVVQTCIANLAVGLFNLLPGLPLDGGRMLRAATWQLTGRREYGTTVGVVGAGTVVVALAFWAMFGLVTDARDQWLRLIVCLLLAWFVLAGASAERAADQRRRWPGSVSVRELVRPIVQLPAESPVADALLAAAGRGVVLVRADRVAVGLLDQTAAERLATRSPQAPAERAAEVINPDTIIADTDGAEAVLERVQSVLAWQFLVVDGDGRPSGVLRREDLRAAVNRGHEP